MGIFSKNAIFNPLMDLKRKQLGGDRLADLGLGSGAASWTPGQGTSRLSSQGPFGPAWGSGYEAGQPPQGSSDANAGKGILRPMYDVGGVDAGADPSPEGGGSVEAPESDLSDIASDIFGPSAGPGHQQDDSSSGYVQGGGVVGDYPTYGGGGGGGWRAPSYLFGHGKDQWNRAHGIETPQQKEERDKAEYDHFKSQTLRDGSPVDYDWLASLSGRGQVVRPGTLEMFKRDKDAAEAAKNGTADTETSTNPGVDNSGAQANPGFSKQDPLGGGAGGEYGAGTQPTFQGGGGQQDIGQAPEGAQPEVDTAAPVPEIEALSSLAGLPVSSGSATGNLGFASSRMGAGNQPSFLPEIGGSDRVRDWLKRLILQGVR